MNSNPELEDVDDHHTSSSKDHENAPEEAEEEEKGGELECLKEMPVDILLEIFSNLDPNSVLHLSEASKGLHDILTSPNAIYLWHLAYNNIQSPCPKPPACPADTKIISYTRFLYGAHCQFCGSDNDIFYHIPALVRFCVDCVRAGLLIDADKCEYEIIQLCHSQKFRKLHNRRLIVKYEYDLRHRERAVAIDHRKLGEYMVHRMTIIVDRERCVAQFRLWKDQFESWQLRKLLVERRRNIRRKLRTEGYGEEVNKYTIDHLPRVNDIKPLTDFEWKRIRVDIIENLLDFAEDDETRKIRSRLLVNLGWIHDIIHDQLKIHRCKIPATVFHIATSQPFLAYLKQEMIADVPELESQLREFVTTWRHDMDDHLASLLPDQSPHKPATDPRRLLKLATTFFTCPSCTELLSYPRILMHKCMIQVPISHSLDEVAAPDTVQEVAEPPSQQRRPRPRRVIDQNCILTDILQDFGSGIEVGRIGLGIAFSQTAYTAACRIVLSFGEDPKTVTFAEMEERNGRIECMRCFRGPQHPPTHRKLVMTWTQAILHDLETHYWKHQPHETVWRVIRSDIERATIDQIESQRGISEKWYAGLPECAQQEKLDLFGLYDIRAHLEQNIEFSMRRPPYPVRHSPLRP